MNYKLFDKQERGLLNEDIVAKRYSEYLQQLISENPRLDISDVETDENVLTFEEFKEYHVLNVIGRAEDFTENMARDYQFTAVLEDNLRYGK